ncbi:MAG: nucleotide-binding protein, partial [Bacteroidaceae bacterium]|nr:nucleotide-binding protein [Bacteroidaceae bacterium]
MKKILKTLALATLGVFALASCEDVPAPYVIPGSNGTVKLEGTGSFDSPYNVAAANKLARELEQSSTSNTVLSEEVYVKGIISQIESIDT